MLNYLRLELLQVLRDRHYLFFTLAVPVGFYLLWSNIFTGDRPDPITGLAAPVDIMVSMASYGALGATLMTTGVRLAAERRSGWLRQLRVTPLKPGMVIVVKTLAAMSLGLPAVVLVGLASVVTQGVRLDPVQWIVITALLWVGTLPFAALGTLIGSLVGPDAAQPITIGAYFALAIGGGMWMPLSVLPQFIRNIAGGLPSTRFAELGRAVAAGHAPSVTAGLVLAAWTLGLGALAVVAYRRASMTA
ncbi:ABC transporter permease [Streptosporangium lutulentum]|uniref:ABC-2 type transport system permease protein n=1 Tax=Streptosporangium lutulentum TaxID=1461250 RepID=A0ABT9QM96_9ACTN|nr:ABC transporter permease [Streptosporangium lutulentum]MDP9847871.1 ABC-2 type transport system permease protein [Streptosporangium lutulentum]